MAKKIKAQYVYDTEEPERCIAIVHEASKASVDRVLSAPTTGDNGRSEWMWVRLPNGDLILGVYPQGDTYLEVENDAVAQS